MGPPLEKQLETKEKEFRDLREELENELQSTALPLLEKADIALDMLEMRDIAELKSMKTPQEQLKKIMATIAAVVYNVEVRTEADWRAKAGHSLVPDLKDFQRDEILVEGSAQVKQLEEHCADEELSIQEMEKFKGPRIAKCLNTWIWAMRGYAEIRKKIQPRMDKMRKLEVEVRKLYEEKKELESSKPKG
ncbi:DNAH2 [Symbiodinium necroappetens]|uniref:DNAH2 protein n=1 Tax=Symbiodinium necroappetens TaxID=1628268 RepID=A0A812T314_9DINO|nr:DNAH2 [Symbiodinium necroappetens]